MKSLNLLLLALLTLVSAGLFPTPLSAQAGPADEIVDTTVEAAEETSNAFDAFVTRLTTAPQSSVAQILLLVGGVVLLLIGWRVYDLIVVLAGFVVGGAVALALVEPSGTFLELVVWLMGGLVGAALGALLTMLAIFLIGMYLGVSFTQGLALAFGLAPAGGVPPLALLVGGIVGGILLVGLSFEFLVILSAVVGAQMVGVALNLSPLGVLALVIVGTLIQIGALRSSGYKVRRRRGWRRRRAT